MLKNPNRNLNSVRPLSKAPSRFSRKKCPWFLAAIGIISILFGFLILRYGRGLLVRYVVSPKMAIEPENAMFRSWLNPPVDTYLTVYAFDIVNPYNVLEYGAKPIVREVGPFVYKNTIIKDSDELLWGDEPRDGPTMRYRPRKIMTFMPEFSAEDVPITVPNIPFLTGLNDMEEGRKVFGVPILTSVGRGTPFVNVTVKEFLWGYEDELPCLQMGKPVGCTENHPFESNDDPFADDDDDDFFDDDFRKKRSVGRMEGEKKSAEFVDCKCNWGLFRSRNVTLREPIEFRTGSQGKALFNKGEVVRFDDKPSFGHWKHGSQCDRVRGQDASTFPPGISKNSTYEIFIPVICRPLPLVYESEGRVNGVEFLKFILPRNALGSHTDTDPALRNKENECYCMKDQGYACHKSGVLNLGPCKRYTGKKPPLAISLPHFYNADPSYVEAIDGLYPQKERHQFYLDLVPELGIPLAIRPRFQMNVALKKDEYLFKYFKEDIMMPVLWAEDGFETPSSELMKRVSKGVHMPTLVVNWFGAVAIVCGLALLAVVCLWFYYHQRKGKAYHGPVGFQMINTKHPMTRV